MMDITDETELTLAEACRIFFRDKIKPASLRAEAKRGDLAIIRVGRHDFVTPAAIRDMRAKKSCQESVNRPGSTSERTRAPGSSVTDRSQSAQAAVQTTAEALKRLSPNTLQKNSRLQSAKVIPLA
jgi:hypothetical protein